ncbi:MAG TPA: saccharopine dehydrogenase family protein [Bryobacteraceae bacterium]|nr:saccharopine dehydrogenase family protein [Bryobacteraceae bacterium]
MNKNVLLLGLGMQGQAALYDLVNSVEIAHVVVADNRPDLAVLLSRYPSEKVTGVPLDVSDEASVERLMREADVVVEALPAVLVLRIGQLAAQCGVSLVSSMFYLNPEGLDEGAVAAVKQEICDLDRVAEEKGITILTEFGMDPGLDLVMAKKAVSELDEVHEFHTYGAGLPAPNARGNPLQYKFSWSPIGVMRAYKRQSTMVSGGKSVDVAADAIFEPRYLHTIDVPEIGAPMECFPNGDAVHYAELLGIRASLKESGRYTGRLPGHCAFWNTMVKSGFLDEQPVLVGDALVSPREFTTALLASQEQFQFGEGEQDLSFIRVDARGVRAGMKKRVLYQLIDLRDLKTGFTSMQRLVGFTMSLGARLILSGKLQKPGVLTGLDVPYESVLPALEKHGIRPARQEWSE